MMKRWLFGLCVSSVLTVPAAAVEPNDPYYASSGAWQQQYDDQWALKRIGFTPLSDRESAWNIEDGSRNPVIVAVLDTGLDYHHPDLNRANVWRNAKEVANGVDDDGNGYVDDLIGWNFIDRNNDPWDLSGHGTFVAGIIAAQTGNAEGVAGINRGVRIMPLRVMNFVGAGLAVGVAEAIYYAVGNGARVINLSLGSPGGSPAEARAIQYAIDQGVVVVAAAGNDSNDITGFGPAASPGVVTVAATDYADQRAGFSNWGAQVAIAAPGTDILSLRARRTDFILTTFPKMYLPGDAFVGTQAKYYRASGTSFAAPLVSGVASLVFAKHPELKGGDVRRVLLQSARDIGVAGVDQYSGFGLLDARAALAADPAFFVDASITGVSVVQQDGSPFLAVLGTADANSFGSASLEIGMGEAPKSWIKVAAIPAAVAGAAIASIDARKLQGATQWTVRLVVTHKNGRTREARYLVNLG
jgi:subtilisin family serine protease